METVSRLKVCFGCRVQRFLEWLFTLLPEPTQKIPSLVPEVDPIMYPECTTMLESTMTELCPNAKTKHHAFIPFPDLDLSDLPDRWRQAHVLQDIRDIAQRVVKLRLRKKSPDRFAHLPDGLQKNRLMRTGHHGTGFVTCDERWGVLVHTSKHVIMDPFEAAHTDVIFFFDHEGEGVTCQGSGEGFRTVWANDYSAFTLQRPLPPEVEARLHVSTEKTFSWRAFSLCRLRYRQSRDIDVVIISHPHGSAKKVTFGTMIRRHTMTAAFYDATTCPGSSGAPVIRLSDDYRHYVTAGQFVHHGYDNCGENTATAVGSLRLPFTLPYYRFLDMGRIRRLVAILYEPLSYWSLFLTDVLEVEGLLFNMTDNFCYFLTIYGYFAGWDNPWTLLVFRGFLVLTLAQMTVYAVHGGLLYLMLRVLHSLHFLAMHWVTWLVCYVVPQDFQSLLWMFPLWLAVLLLSRYLSLDRLLGVDMYHTFLKIRL